MVAELQTEDAEAIDRQPTTTVDRPSPTLRLLARVPRVDDRRQLPMQTMHKEVLVVDSHPVGEPLLVVNGELDNSLPEVQAERFAQADWISRLCEIHATMAPYAGLIVTFALFMSAGLLYWLVFGPFSNANLPQEPMMGRERVGQHSSDPNIHITEAPDWSAPKPQSDVTEKKPVISKEKTAQSVLWQHNPIPGTVAVDEKRDYPKTHYERYDFDSSESGAQDPHHRHKIASGSERNQTR